MLSANSTSGWGRWWITSKRGLNIKKRRQLRQLHRIARTEGAAGRAEIPIRREHGEAIETPTDQSHGTSCVRTN